MRKNFVWLLIAMVLVFTGVVQSTLAQDVTGKIVASDGTWAEIDIGTLEEEDTHWFSVQIENSTAAAVTVNSVDIVLTWETKDITVLEVEKDNTAFYASTFSWSVDKSGPAGLYTTTISMADVDGIELAVGIPTPTTLIAAWIRIDPSAMHVDTLYDVGLYTETFDGVNGIKYKRNDTAQVYCDTIKGDNSFGGPADPVTAFDVLMVVQQSSGAADHLGTSQLLWDVMDVDADGEITGEDVYYTLEKAANAAYPLPADTAGHHPAPARFSANSAFAKQTLGDPSASCVFRLSPLEWAGKDHYKVYLEAEGMPQKPTGIDVDFSKTPDLQVSIEPTEFLGGAENASAVKDTTVRLVFAQLTPFESSGRIAEIDIRTPEGRLPEFAIQSVYINEGRPVELGESQNIVRWEAQKLLAPRTKLMQNYPNPFNPETWIPYQLAEPADVSITIFNVSGQMIRQLQLGTRDVGFYVDKSRAAYWDGKNAVGEQVSSGIYFYNIQAGAAVSTRKMVVVR